MAKITPESIADLKALFQDNEKALGSNFSQLIDFFNNNKVTDNGDGTYSVGDINLDASKLYDLIRNAGTGPLVTATDFNKALSSKADDSTVVHTADMRKPASDVAGIEEVNTKQDKLTITPADDSKVVHTADMRKPASDVVGLEELQELDGRHSEILDKDFDTMENRAIFWDDELKERAINIKWLGAKGDGISDDSPIFQEAITLGLPIFVPAGTYNFNKSVTVNETTYGLIFGNMPVSTWNNSNIKPIILSKNGYAFSFASDDAGKSCIDFKNICFQGDGLENIDSSQIINCEFSGDVGIKNGKTDVLERCSFHGCTTAGIIQLTDTRVNDCDFYSNGTGLQLDASNDNIISNNRIEWNNLGMSIQGNNNLILGNNFDRNTTYGLYVNQLYLSSFYNNHFERNLTNNVYFFYGSKISFCNNTVVAKHKDDTDTSTVLPLISIKIHYLEYSIMSNNNIFCPSGGGMLEKDGTATDTSFKINNNILNGIDIDNLVGNFTTPQTSTSNTEATFTMTFNGLASKYGFNTSTVDSSYFNLISYNIKLSDSTLYYYNKDVSCGIGSDNNPFIKIYNSTNTPITVNNASLIFSVNYEGMLNLRFT